MSILQRVCRIISPPKPEAGEPLHLVFQCDDWIDNARPPVMSEEDRAIALDQARHTRCHRCAPWVWKGIGPLWQPELQAALRDAWRRR